jgi:hypothetical protein
MLGHLHLPSLKLERGNILDTGHTVVITWRNETYSAGPIRSITGPGIRKVYNKQTVICRGDYRRGFGMDIGFIDHLHRHVSTSNYSATANLHNSQITTPPAKHFQSRSLATASNSGDSSASRAQVPSSQTPIQNWLSSNHIENTALLLLSTFFSAEMRLPRYCVATTEARTTENTVPLLPYYYCHGDMFTEPLSISQSLLSSDSIRYNMNGVTRISSGKGVSQEILLNT